MKLYDLEDSTITHVLGKFVSPSDRYNARKARAKASAAAKAKIKDALSKGHKLCTKCDESKSLFEFDVDKKTYTGYSSWCKACKKEYNKSLRTDKETNTSVEALDD